MVRVFRSLLEKYFSDDEAIVLFLLLLGATLAIVFLGGMLAPVIAAAVIAFILQGLVARLNRWGLPPLVSITLVFLLFLGGMLGFLFGVMPLVWTQITTLAGELPRIVRSTQQYLTLLPQEYPQLVSGKMIETLYLQISGESAKVTQWIVSLSIESIPGLVALLIYLVLLPILVFFFLKDRDLFLSAIGRALPRERRMINRVWGESSLQLANYVRGKALEILIVGSVTYVGFKVLGLNYSALLALLVGLSVVIPFIGAALVTIPVAMIALFQWGWGNEFIWLMAVYGIIQALDGNVLVPLLFSEVVNLHPVVIVVAVLFFGGIWGGWGVFFAIPLATLLKAVITAWPVRLPSEESG